MRRVLIVEDSEDIRFTLSQLLTLEGYEVVEAGDGAQALDLARNASPDLVLMDLSIPVIDGFEAARQLRQNAALREVPIIALTGHDLSDFQARIAEAGFTDSLAKPVDFDALTDTLSRYLSAES
ncbi:MAG TPA: response regulator [Blastocatellia bacterium]|nr:response regulator [Blastocatellia bacterium]